MKRTLIALALAAVLPMSAQAAGLSYNYFQGGYSSLHIFGTNFDGLALGGSIRFSDDFYGTVNYTRGTKSGFELDESSVNFGYHHGISDTTDLFAEAGWVHDKLDFGFPGFNAKDNGYRVAAGVRGMMSDKFEGTADVTYTDVGDFGNGFGAGVNGVWHFTPTWGVYASYDYTKRQDTNLSIWGVGFRATF